MKQITKWRRVLFSFIAVQFSDPRLQHWGTRAFSQANRKGMVALMHSLFSALPEITKLSLCFHRKILPRWFDLIRWRMISSIGILFDKKLKSYNLPPVVRRPDSPQTNCGFDGFIPVSFNNHSIHFLSSQSLSHASAAAMILYTQPPRTLLRSGDPKIWGALTPSRNFIHWAKSLDQFCSWYF